MKNNKLSSDIFYWLFFEIFSLPIHHSPYFNSNRYEFIINNINELMDIISQFKSHIKENNIINNDRSVIELNYSLVENNNLNIKKFFNIELKNMSSGEMALLEQIGKIDNSIKKMNKKGIKKILLLIDEGDAFLHLDWQRKYIFTLNKVLSRIKQELKIEALQLILATHSPILATDIPKEFICRLGTSSKNDISGFAAPLYQLLDESFDTKTIGQFSSEKINKVIDRINKNENEIEDSDCYIIDQIDNNLIKNELKNLIKQKRK